jgi:hypothetical protein
VCEVTLFSYVQALTERQPQLEKKPMRGKAPLSRKAVIALCVASFIVGLLFSGGKVSLTSESGSRDGAKEESTRASGCETKHAEVCVLLHCTSLVLIQWLQSVLALARISLLL